MTEALQIAKRKLFVNEVGKRTVMDSTGERAEIPERPGVERQSGSMLSQIRDFVRHREISEAAETLSQFRFYRQWQLGPEAPVRRSQAADAPNACLAGDASNLAVVLSRIRKSPEAKRALVEGVRAVYAGADDVEVVPEGGGLRIFVQEGRHAIPSTRLSDGTLHWLCLLAVLLDPQPPPLVCIEEPEIALHPDLIQILAGLLREAAERTQIIVTTHSESLVDKFTDTPEVVIVCEREGDETTMRRLKRKDLAVWLKRYSLGELWRKGELGGTRWRRPHLRGRRGKSSWDECRRGFGTGFQRKATPQLRDVEAVLKPHVYAALKRATRRTQRGEYDKTRHGFALLAEIDAEKVRGAAPYFNRLCRHVAALG